MGQNSSFHVMFFPSRALRCVSEKFVLNVSIAVMTSLNDNVLLDPNHPVDNIENEDTHRVQIIKFVCNFLCKVLLHHHEKLFTCRYVQDNKGSVRHKMNKTVLFLGL